MTRMVRGMTRTPKAATRVDTHLLTIITAVLHSSKSDRIASFDSEDLLLIRNKLLTLRCKWAM